MLLGMLIRFPSIQYKITLNLWKTVQCNYNERLDVNIPLSILVVLPSTLIISSLVEEFKEVLYSITYQIENESKLKTFYMFQYLLSFTSFSLLSLHPFKFHFNVKNKVCRDMWSIYESEINSNPYHLNHYQ